MLTGLSPSQSVGRSVSLSVRRVNCGKKADWIWMPFGVMSGVGRVMGVFDGGGDRRREGTVLGMGTLWRSFILCREGWRRGCSQITLGFVYLTASPDAR